MPGSLLTQWTIRLALACLVVYFAALLCNSAPRAGKIETLASRKKFAWLRWIWTAGCLLFIAHVACAFQFTHHWSHTHAWEHTAAETKRMMGFAFGNGIYVSYCFLLLWVADVALQWLNVARPAWLLTAAYLFMFFIAFNGAIIFEDGPTRPVGIVVCAVVLLPIAAWFVWKQVASHKPALPATEVEA
ncbi:hypothetical protein [Anatilimnocola floriformis]|uniref:hypothetical protein n=1 Tax=Anatilimnocola floriformis TaxID=2948575 RepID=UPI0020C4E365|nr:hypothetical protein [Anatilimnocola floriformis]